MGWIGSSCPPLAQPPGLLCLALALRSVPALSWQGVGRALLGSTDGFLINTLAGATHFHMSFVFKCCGG